jgi:hypothetical protein
VTEERWPGEDRISATEEDELRAEPSEPENDADVAEGENGHAEGDGEPAPLKSSST